MREIQSRTWTEDGATTEYGVPGGGLQGLIWEGKAREEQAASGLERVEPRGEVVPGGVAEARVGGPWQWSCAAPREGGPRPRSDPWRRCFVGETDSEWWVVVGGDAGCWALLSGQRRGCRLAALHTCRIHTCTSRQLAGSCVSGGSEAGSQGVVVRARELQVVWSRQSGWRRHSRENRPTTLIMWLSITVGPETGIRQGCRVVQQMRGLFASCLCRLIRPALDLHRTCTKSTLLRIPWLSRSFIKPPAALQCRLKFQ